MSFMNESLKLMNIKLQLNNLNIQFDTLLAQLQNNLAINIGATIEEISLKLLNLGLEMLNIEMQSNNITLFNSTQQIKNIGDMLQNISMQMTNMNAMKMNNMNMNMGMPLQNMMQLNNFNINNPTTKIYNVCFNEDFNKDGRTKVLVLANEGLTIKEMIDKYFIKSGRSRDKNYGFLYNSYKININDNMNKVGKFFKEPNNPNISVIEIVDLIGG